MSHAHALAHCYGILGGLLLHARHVLSHDAAERHPPHNLPAPQRREAATRPGSNDKSVSFARAYQLVNYTSILHLFATNDLDIFVKQREHSRLHFLTFCQAHSIHNSYTMLQHMIIKTGNIYAKHTANSP